LANSAIINSQLTASVLGSAVIKDHRLSLAVRGVFRSMLEPGSSKEVVLDPKSTHSLAQNWLVDNQKFDNQNFDKFCANVKVRIRQH